MLAAEVEADAELCVLAVEEFKLAEEDTVVEEAEEEGFVVVLFPVGLLTGLELAAEGAAVVLGFVAVELLAGRFALDVAEEDALGLVTVVLEAGRAVLEEVVVRGTAVAAGLEFLEDVGVLTEDCAL